MNFFSLSIVENEVKIFKDESRPLDLEYEIPHYSSTVRLFTD